jgi:nicotinamide-nucleotide amidase
MPIRAHANTVVAYLEDRNETVSVAESITAGGLGHALTFTPGASKVFMGGIIAYTNDVKINILGVNPLLIEEFSVVSEEVANAMADAAKEKFGTTWGIAEGTVWVAIRGPINQTVQLQLDRGREAIRTGAISSAIGTFARILSYRTT